MRGDLTISLPFLLLILWTNTGYAQLSERNSALKSNAYFYLQHQNYPEVMVAAKELPATVYDKYLLMGLSHFHSDHLEEAEQWFANGMKQFPDSLKLATLQVEVLFFKEKYQEMLSLFHTVESKVGMQKAAAFDLEALRPKVAYVYQKLARDDFQQKAYKTSEKAYLKALKYETSAEAYLGLCLSLLEQENWEGLVQYANQGLAKYPEQTDLSGLLANAYFKMGDYKKLQNIYTKIYEADPKNINKALTLGEVMMANNDFQAAQLHYDYLLTNFPNNAAVYDAALQISSQYRNLDSRIAILERKRQYIPNNETVADLATAYQLSRQWAKAIHLYDSMADQTENKLPYQVKIVKVYERSDSLTIDLAYLEKLMLQHPEEASFGLGYLKALKYLNCAQQLDKLTQITLKQLAQNSAMLTHNATLLASCGQTEAAYKMLQQAITQDSVPPMAYAKLADLSVEESLGSNSETTTYMMMAAQQLLTAIAEDETTLKTLSLSNPFDALWLDLPAMNERMEQHQEQLKLTIGQMSQHLKIDTTELLFSKLQQEFDENALLVFLVGQHYAYYRQKEQAISHYKKAIALEPQLLAAQYEWARLNEKSKNTQEAIAGYEKTLAIDDQFNDAYDGLIRLYRQNGELERLTDRWQMIYSNNRANAVLKNALIEALHKQGKTEQAKAILEND